MIPRVGVATATVVLALVLTACSDAEEPAAGGSADAGTSESPAPSEGTEESSPVSPSESPETPEVAPATGPVLQVKGMKVNAPEGWETTMRAAVGHGSFPPGQVGTGAGLTRFPNTGLFTVDELGNEQVDEMGKGGKRLGDLEIDGAQVYHLVGSPEKGVQLERFGTIAEDQRVALEFRFANGESRTARDEIIQSMLATLEIG
ncbi:hypothetical protein [Nocardioides sediminis]|uniref:hypothetical protein n=1 Tax=Nocardioides sediminis TaxID=433648 RepID=UPI00131F0CBB|nr:hypothetical protein [Nocardioides sediminis]